MHLNFCSKLSYPALPDNVGEIVDINRKLFSRFQELSLLKGSSPSKVPTKPSATDNSADNVDSQQVQQQITEVVKELSLVGNLIGESLRKRETSELDLSNVFFYHCDLSGARLDRAILAGASFQQANVSGMSLVNIEQFDTTSWYDTRCWTAREIMTRIACPPKERLQTFLSRRHLRCQETHQR